MAINDAFRVFAVKCSTWLGSPWAFSMAVFSVVVWAVCGPAAGYSEDWQLIINTSTSVITFLMIFLVQSTQNRESQALQLKIDELLRAVDGARVGLVNLDKLSDEDLKQLKAEFERIGLAAPAHDDAASRDAAQG